MNTDWGSDQRLDILVLGPMGEDETKPTSTLPVQDAFEALLEEQEFQDLLASRNIQSITVHVPVGQDAQEIVENVLRLLDTADLAVFNLTPKANNPDRANVFYELGLVHALGIPAMVVVLKDVEIPFYAQTMMQHRVDSFAIESLANALRPSLRAFLDPDTNTRFTNDRVSQFYRLPIVDISAAVGLATSYYHNFLARLIRDGGFISAYPGAYRHVVYVRPSSLETTYEADMSRLRAGLEAENLTLETSQLDAIPADNRGPIWYEHVEDIVVDIPRTIYPLRRSPRLLSFLDRNKEVEGTARQAFGQRLHQIEASLLDRVKVALDFQVTWDGPDVRKDMLHFTTLEEAPALVQRLLQT